MLRPQGWVLLLACMLAGLCSQTARALDDAASHKRWIIITSISYPTEAIKVLAKMPDWKVQSPQQPLEASNHRCTS